MSFPFSEGIIFNRIDSAIKQSKYSNFLEFTDKDGINILIHKDDIMRLHKHLIETTTHVHGDFSPNSDIINNSFI